jgi:hypothetical protein
MGFWDSLQSTFLGGLGKSTNPSDYGVANPQQAAISGMLGQSAAQVDPTQQAQFRNMQMQQAQQLAAIASGQQKGAGELAADRSVQQAMAAQQAQAASARGGANAALAFRQSARNQAGIGLSGAGQAQQAALQDQLNAQQALTGALGQGRGQDIGMGTTNAQLAQNQYGQNLGALTGINGQQLGAQQNAMQAALGQQGILGGLLNTGGALLGMSALRGGSSGGAPASSGGGYMGGSGYGMQGSYSDENLKTDIADGGDDIDAMLDGLVAKTYRYKDEKHGVGARSGIMAQDLQRSRAGAAVVVPAPDGLALDPNKAISAMLASAARLNQRMRKLESRG